MWGKELSLKKDNITGQVAYRSGFIIRRFALRWKLVPIYGLLTLIFILMVMLLPQPAWGQEVTPIEATVNTKAVTTDELVILTVVVADDSPQQPRPILPRLDGMAVIDLDISTDVSMSNGQIHTQVTYTYLLQPRRTGVLTIPPVTVEIDEEIYKSKPITVQVELGTAPAPSPGNAVNPEYVAPPAGLDGQDFFVEAHLDLATPYVGQQLIYTFRFYQALQVYRQPQYEDPLFTGFDTAGLPVQEYNVDISDRTYLVTEIRTGLMPKTSGKLMVGPARLMLPGNIYEDPVDLYTEPVELMVKALPPGAPPNFSGAVGQYQMESWFSPQVAVVKQPSTFSIAVSGIGNIEALPEPIWPDLYGWKSYNSLTSMTTEMKDDLVTGTRVYERIIIPTEIGEFTIDGASFIYFDPIATEYRTLTTDPVTIKIIPAPTPDPTTLATIPTATPASVAAAANTPVPAHLQRFPAQPDESSAWSLGIPFAITFFFICIVVPLALVLGGGGVWLWQQQKSPIVVESVARPVPPAAQAKPIIQQPVQRTHPALSNAMRKSGDDNYKGVSLALTTYLSDVLDTAINGLTRPDLAARLRERGLDESHIQQIEDYLAQSEIGRYGPASDDGGWGLLTATDKLLFELDKLFGTR